MIPAAIALLLALPVHAQEIEPDEDVPTQDGSSLIEDGARMFFEGLMKETRPAMKGMRELAERLGPQLRSFAEEMGPALADILDDVEDLSVYEAPEKLPNGDIIIRRKKPEDLDKPDLPPLDGTGDDIEI